MAENNDWPEFAPCNGGAGCVIVEEIAGAVVIRDSKNLLTQPGLVFSRKEYADFRRRVRGGSTARTILQSVASMLRSAALIVRHVLG
jgi:hypothetical protein